MFVLLDYFVFDTNFEPKLQYVFCASVIVKSVIVYLIIFLFTSVYTFTISHSVLQNSSLLIEYRTIGYKSSKNDYHSRSDAFKMISMEKYRELSPKVREYCCYRLLDAQHDFMIFHT